MGGDSLTYNDEFIELSGLTERGPPPPPPPPCFLFNSLGDTLGDLLRLGERRGEFLGDDQGDLLGDIFSGDILRGDPLRGEYPGERARGDILLDGEDRRSKDGGNGDVDFERDLDRGGSAGGGGDNLIGERDLVNLGDDLDIIFGERVCLGGDLERDVNILGDLDLNNFGDLQCGGDNLGDLILGDNFLWGDLLTGDLYFILVSLWDFFICLNGEDLLGDLLGDLFLLRDLGDRDLRFCETPLVT